MGKAGVSVGRARRVAAGAARRCDASQAGSSDEEEVTGLAQQRQFFAEEVQACANLQTAALVDALAAVSREAFLPPGPWTIRSEGDAAGGPRRTPDADPRRIYHNVSVAIDADRQLFNGAPTVVAPAIDVLGLSAGNRVLHIGCGLGYYTALIASIVGPGGRVSAVEVDDALAAAAARNLSAFPWVTVRCGNGAEPLREPLDAILMHAGVTHPLDTWLDALEAGGRLCFPITATMPVMGPIGKGFMFLVTRRADQSFDARPLSLVAIYTASDIRDDSLNPMVGAALMKGFFPRVSRLRRDRHEPGPECWLHGPTCCLGA
jgi:protein-L-isoaspartate(D-aspartate) O-methyltransferase